MNPLQFFVDLTNPDLSFLPKALVIAVMSSIICGVVGTHVVLRGMAFIGDAVAHSVFPGLAIAFAVGGNLVLGGTIAGLVTAVLVAVFAQNRRLNETSIIGVLFVAAFALGVVIISQVPGYAGSLQQFLFGSITGIPDSDLIVVGVTGVVVLGILFVFHKEFVTVSLDRESARAMGVHVFWFDLLLYMLVTFAVVVSVQTIGNILVLALLVTPAATARLLTDRLGVMMAISPVIGGLGALAGLYISWGWDLPTGGTIVLVITGVFLLAWFFSPKQGVLVRMIKRRAHRTGQGDANFAMDASALEARSFAKADTPPSRDPLADTAVAARVATHATAASDAVAAGAALAPATAGRPDESVLASSGIEPRRSGPWPVVALCMLAVAGIGLMAFGWFMPAVM